MWCQTEFLFSHLPFNFFSKLNCDIWLTVKLNTSSHVVVSLSVSFVSCLLRTFTHISMREFTFYLIYLSRRELFVRYIESIVPLLFYLQCFCYTETVILYILIYWVLYFLLPGYHRHNVEFTRIYSHSSTVGSTGACEQWDYEELSVHWLMGIKGDT